MNHKTEIALSSLVGIVLTYAVCAFVVWDANPANWHPLWRFACIFLALFAALVCAAITVADSIRREESGE